MSLYLVLVPTTGILLSDLGLCGDSCSMTLESDGALLQTRIYTKGPRGTECIVISGELVSFLSAE